MYQNQKIFIFGMAKSGYECAKFLSKNNEILITDAKEQEEEHLKLLKQLGVTFIQTDTPEELLDETFDVVVKNPGIIMTHPLVKKAQELQIPIINEMEVAYHYLPENVTIIGVTGSNGKTTTTTLIYEMLKKMNVPVHLGGNIGFPLCSILPSIKPNDVLLLEISDHQLLNMKDFKTNISVLTNLCPTHLDFHGSYENYKKVKQKIFQHHTQKDIAIINATNEDSLKETEKIPSQKKYFTKQDCYINENTIYLNDEPIIHLEDIKLKGMHNYENIMAALLVVNEFHMQKEKVCEVLKNFGGVEHRLEFVKRVNDIDYYNDSKSTNPTSTITALKSFQTPVLLILGGFERQQDFFELKEHMQYVKKIYAMGETKDRVEEFAKKMSIPCTKKETLQEVMKEIKKDAIKNDTVLLSPACASWDQYDKFEDRGAEFKSLI